ncbi:TPA: hypothetical protein ACUT9R_005802 [Pseudomonas aeruginosa]|nr:hypothetical protein [Pseudomonas aeruginosa]MCO3818134.1 hypothetical protein [Pseudomonas aeruginosa]
MTQYPLEQRIFDSLKKISKISLEQNLGRLRLQLQDLYTDTPNDHDKVATEIRSKLDNEPALATLIIDWEKTIEHEREKLKGGRSDEKKDRHQKNILRPTFALSVKYATLYIELAHKAKREGKIEQAWAYAFEAAHLCGEISANSIIELDALTIEKTSKQNSDNAKGINRKSLLLKEYIASLIRENTPQDGWSTKKEAISTITSLKSPNKNNEKPKTLIEEFIKNNDIIRPQSSNITDLLLRNWIYEPGAIQDALKKAIRPTKKNSERDSF